jgi:hypothetical protein
VLLKSNGNCPSGTTKIRLGARGQIGPTGAKGQRGPKGPGGPAGPSDAYQQAVSSLMITASDLTNIAALSLPAGSYVITATQKVHNESDTNTAPVNCLLDLGQTIGDSYSIQLQAFTSAGFSTTTMSVTKAGTFAVTTKVVWRCQDNGTPDSDSITVSNVHLVAIEVGALHTP